MRTINELVGGLIVDGMSRKEIGDRLGIAGDTLTNKCKGVYDWKWSEVLAICELAGVSLGELDPTPTRKEDA